MQVVPFFVMKISERVPGLPGLFIAGLFSGGLSTISGGLNSLSCMVYDDFLRQRYTMHAFTITNHLNSLFYLSIDYQICPRQI